jgi:hypothetical protein
MADLAKLQLTLPTCNRQSLLNSLRNAVVLYRQLQEALYDDKVHLQNDTAEKVMAYFAEMESRK